MMTPRQITQRLDEAAQEIAAGDVGSDPQRYLAALWDEVYEDALDELQPAIYGRMVEFSAQLGLPQPTGAGMRLASPRWDSFIAALDDAPDAVEDEAAFQRHLAHALTPLLEGLTEDDRIIVSAAADTEMEDRGLAARPRISA